MNERSLTDTSEQPTTLVTDDGVRIVVPAIVAAAGPKVHYTFFELFLAQLENPNTQAAYARRLWDFCRFIEERGISDVRAVRSLHIAAYRDHLRKKRGMAKSSVKQALAAIRRMYDFFSEKHHVEFNPAASVRGPKVVVREGLTYKLDNEDAARIFETLPTDNLVGLRDRALIGLMAYTFARVSAALGMNVGDYYPEGKHWVVRLAEKNDTINVVPVHHILMGYLDEYIAAARIGNDRGSPLFRAALGNTKLLTPHQLSRRHALRMMKRRARQAGLAPEVVHRICNHTWRKTGITNYLMHGGSIDSAQLIAGHADPRTTRLYDGRDGLKKRSEIERIRYERGI